jgi:hypothetical protein
MMARRDIYIDGQSYILDPEYGDKAYSEDPIDSYKGASPNELWQNWTMRSFHGGERQEVMVSGKDMENNQYDEGEGLAFDHFGKVTLQPALARDLVVSSANLPMAVSSDGAKLFLGLAVSPYIKIWTNSAWSNPTTVAGSGAVTDLLVAGSTLYAVRGGKVLTSTDAGANWTELKYTPRVIASITVGSGGSDYTSAPTVSFTGDSGSGATAHATVSGGKVTAIVVDTPGTGYNDAPTVVLTGGGGTGASAYAVTGLGSLTSYSGAVSIGSVNQKLYVGFSTAGVFNHTDSKVVKTSGAATSMCGYLEDLYWVEDSRLWRFNGKTAFEFDKLPSGFNAELLYAYRSALFIIGWYKEQGGYRAACYYLWSGSENHLCSWGDFNADNRSYAMCGSDDEVWFGVAARGGGDRYDLTYGGLTSGPAWGSAGKIPYKAMAYCDGYFFCGRYDNVAGTDGVYVANLANPTTFRTSGWLITSEYDFDYPDDEKILGSIAVYHRPLIAGQSIGVEYSIDGGGTWTSCVPSSDVGTTRKVWTFPNLRFDTVKLRVTLTGPGTSTPTLKKVLVRACGVAQAKWMWKMHLIADRVASRSGRVRRGYASVKALKESSDKQLPVAFVDRIGVSHTVVIRECTIDQEAVSKRTAYLTVELMEI